LKVSRTVLRDKKKETNKKDWKEIGVGSHREGVSERVIGGT